MKKLVGATGLFLSFVLSIVGCKPNMRTVQVGDMIASGNISDSLVYEGTIVFSNPATARIIFKGNYKHGILDGHQQYYNHENGLLKYECSYNDGKKVGYAQAYDSLGRLQTMNFFFTTCL